MRTAGGSGIEVESLGELDRRVGAGVTSMAGWHLQALDLSRRTAVLRSLDVTGALFLGCSFAPGDEESLRARGALVFPTIPDVPVDAYRARLYSPQELYDGLDRGYEHTLDARVYAWSQQPADLDATLARALHDHAVDDALQEAAGGERVVGVMGGHAVERGAPAYADAARLARDLSRSGLTVATGGGPGAMEAANLGAYLGCGTDDDLEAALGVLASAPSFHPSVTDWARAAVEVTRRWPDGARSFGIPTWHYGHEPPNALATDIAKYFTNAIREDILLHVCRAGIVFLPGAAGTVQEVFQDACENYYADASTVAPMVLVGREYWTDVVPAWPLLEALARDREMASSVHLVDDLSDVLERLG